MNHPIAPTRTSKTLKNIPRGSRLKLSPVILKVLEDFSSLHVTVAFSLSITTHISGDTTSVWGLAGDFMEEQPAIAKKTQDISHLMISLLSDWARGESGERFADGRAVTDGGLTP